MDIVTIDFETYYDKEYSLSKMTTEAYVRDPRFEVIGVGVKVNDYPTDWYSGDNVGKFLNSLDYRNKAILCHHTAFDGAILSWHFGIKPKLWLDTLSMARPLHNLTVGGSLAALTTYYGLGKKGDEVVQALGKRKADFTPEELARYGEYCKNDVELTYALFNKMKKGFPVSELLVIDQTLRMYTEPTIELDVLLLREHLEEVIARKDGLIADMGLTGVTKEVLTKTLMSNEIFSKYLINLGVEPPSKVSARTGKQAWAFSKTDKAFTDLLEHPDERVQNAVAARLGVKSTIEETRTEALLVSLSGDACPSCSTIMVRTQGDSVVAIS
jgi:DNA polymerase